MFYAYIYFDKTGTITSGFFVVCDTLEVDTNNQIDCDALQYAASLESKSAHPLANAIVSQYTGCIAASLENDTLLNVQQVKVLEGIGLEGWVAVDRDESNWRHTAVGNERILSAYGGKTFATSKGMEQYQMFCNKYSGIGTSILLVSVDDELRLLVAMNDSVRSEAAKMVQTVERAGLSVTMLTGDHLETAVSVAAIVGR